MKNIFLVLIFCVFCLAGCNVKDSTRNQNINTEIVSKDIDETKIPFESEHIEPFVATYTLTNQKIYYTFESNEFIPFTTTEESDCFYYEWKNGDNLTIYMMSPENAFTKETVLTNYSDDVWKKENNITVFSFEETDDTLIYSLTYNKEKQKPNVIEVWHFPENVVINIYYQFSGDENTAKNNIKDFISNMTPVN